MDVIMERLRAATPDERIRAGFTQVRISFELFKGGLRARFPEAGEDEIEDRAGEILYGPDLWGRVRDARRRRHCSS